MTPTDDDYALYRLAAALGKPSAVVTALHDRAMSAPLTLFNNATGFMEARTASGAWAGPDAGWTEGDKWAYSFDVVHDVPTLVRLRGGNASFVRSLDEHFDGGHNDHSNEVRVRFLKLRMVKSGWAAEPPYPVFVCACGGCEQDAGAGTRDRQGEL